MTKDRLRVAAEVKEVLRQRLLRETPAAPSLYDSLYCALADAADRWASESS